MTRLSIFRNSPTLPT